MGSGSLWLRIGVVLAAATAMFQLLVSGLLAVWPHSAYALTVLMACLVIVPTFAALAYVERRYFPNARAEFRWAQKVWLPVVIIVTVVIGGSGRGSTYLIAALELVVLWCVLRQRPRGRRPTP